MKDYIKPNCLSIGYNNDIGQPFFDLLQKYRQYIHSYFFSPMVKYDGDYMITYYEIQKIKHINTYGIPANILFNSVYQMDNNNWFPIISKLVDIVNITAVTVIDPEVGIKIKKEFPHLDIHISVRYFDADWKYMEDKGCNNLIDKLKQIEGIADVVNLSHLSLYDREIQRICRKMGIKIKILVNEGCISNLHFNYSKLPGCSDLSCYRENKCQYDCIKVTNLYPFMELVRTYLYKEELKYIDYDILKLRSRNISDINEIDRLISYWISPHRTKLVSNIRILSDEAYDIFSKFIRDKARCDHNCSECMKCDEYYNMLREAGEVIDKNYGKEVN